MTLEQKNKIEFVLVSHIKGIFFNPHRPEGLEFIPSSESGLRFVLSPSDPEGDACGNWKGLECKLYFSCPATKEQSDFVVSYNKKVMLRVANDISLPYKPKEEVLINGDGRCKDGFSPRRYLCPKDIQKLIEKTESELSSQTIKFLKILRWRQGFDSPAEIIESQTLYWKVGEVDYPLAPLDGGPHHSVVVPGMYGIHWGDVESNNLQELWAQDDIAEPLGHTLVREAKALATESPRSSILIMTAALETAVKMHISSIAPDADWLMEEIPSPPIFKILKDYIPLIHLRRGNDLTYWVNVKPFIKKVQKLIELRNKVAHTGKIPEDTPPIHENLKLVSDLLYLLDVLDGHDWAKSLASHEFRNALDWPSPRHGRFTVAITEGY
jgi:hypothetical protein